MSNSGIDFERPPVIERVVTVFAGMDEEIYASRFAAWQAKVQSHFPIYEPVTEWRINAELKEGVVSMDPRKAQLSIIPRFSKKTSKAGFDWSLRSPRGALTMNMHSGVNLHRRYHHLRSEFSPWLSRWIEQFDIDEFQRLDLHYVNLINRDTAPDFATSDGRLLLDQLLTVFVHLPGEHQEIVPPLDCKLNLKLRTDPVATLLIHLFAMDAPIQRPTVRLDLAVVNHIPTGTPAAQLLDLLDWCHERILDQFRVVFTEKGIKSFGQVK